MVSGNGFVANRFERYRKEDAFLIFASGVSNSKTNDAKLYQRETKLLKESIRKNRDKVFVYFSTCSVYDSGEKKSAYVQHKLSTEQYIRDHAKACRIFRVSNLAGISPNPNTILNFFFNHVKNGVNFDLWSRACRNILDIDDAYTIIDDILQNNLFINQTVNIANPVSYPVKKIVTTIEHFLGKKASYTEINKGSCYEADLSSMLPVAARHKIRFTAEYLPGLLKKYYTGLS